MSTANVASFRRCVLAFWRAHGRHNLPWRKTKDPYKILVSEVMLQQTQVERVIPFYNNFLKKFPTVRALARAPLSNVLAAWSGLGYNRRAKFLRDAAQTIVGKHAGRVPRSYSELRELSGVGDYTARAVRVFARNEADVLIETNIRTALMHHFSPTSSRVSDWELYAIAEKASKGQDPREWHWALMDYGAYLKKSGVRLNHKSAHYTKQPKFEGSPRQIRGVVLRQLTQSGMIDLRNQSYKRALAELRKDGLVVVRGGKWFIAR